MDCKECKALIDKLGSEELTKLEEAALNGHIRDCESCRRNYAAAKSICEGDLSLTPPEMLEGFTQQVMQKITERSVTVRPKSIRIARWATLAASLVLLAVSVFLVVEWWGEIEGEYALKSDNIENVVLEDAQGRLRGTKELSDLEKITDLARSSSSAGSGDKTCACPLPADSGLTENELYKRHLGEYVKMLQEMDPEERSKAVEALGNIAELTPDQLKALRHMADGIYVYPRGKKPGPLAQAPSRPEAALATDEAGWALDSSKQHEERTRTEQEAVRAREKANQLAQEGRHQEAAELRDYAEVIEKIRQAQDRRDDIGEELGEIIRESSPEKVGEDMRTGQDLFGPKDGTNSGVQKRIPTPANENAAGRIVQADREFQEALAKIDEKDKEAFAHSGPIAQEQKEISPEQYRKAREKMEPLTEMAKEALRQGDYSHAEGMLKSLLEIDPKNSELKKLLDYTVTGRHSVPSTLPRSDTVKLASGGKVEGKVIRETEDSVTIKTPHGELTVKKSDIASIEKGALGGTYDFDLGHWESMSHEEKRGKWDSMSDAQKKQLYEDLWILGERKGEIHDVARQLVQQRTARISETRKQLEAEYNKAKQLFGAGEYEEAKKLFEKCRETIKWFPYYLDTGKDYESLSEKAVRECDRKNREKRFREKQLKETIAAKFAADVDKSFEERLREAQEHIDRFANLGDKEEEQKANEQLAALRAEIAEKKRRICELSKKSDYDATIELKDGKQVKANVWGDWEEGELFVELPSGQGDRIKIKDINKIRFPNLGKRDLGLVTGWGIPAEKVVFGKKAPKKKTWKRSGPVNFARVDVGGGNTLDLVRMQVNVSVEGPRARIVIDHIFYNPHDRQLEGTFEYPLPAGASPCYYAMFIGQPTTDVPLFYLDSEVPGNLAELTPQEMVKYAPKKFWGTLKEARIVKREKARKAYEETVRRKIDPALLEYMGANMFRGRVFPIPAKGYNRVIIAFEQTLERVEGRLRYRFELPDCEMETMEFALTALAARCLKPSCDTKGIEGGKTGERLLYAGEWTKQGPGGEVVFSFAPPREDVVSISGRDGSGTYYFYAHLRPELDGKEESAFAKHAVFVLDTSLSEEPDRFNVNVKLLQRILESDKDLEKFQVLLFDVGAAWLLEPAGFWLENTEKGRKAALKALDKVLLEGATDLSAALDKLAARKELSGQRINIFLLSDGQVNWGRTQAREVVARFESRAKFLYRFFCYRTGLSAENLELFSLLTRSGGAVFNCFDEDTTAKAALAHRRKCLQVEAVKAPGATELLVAGRTCAVYPGGELIVAGKCTKPGDLKIELTGAYQGKGVKYSFPVTVDGKGELAPRAWGEIAVASLVALNDPELNELIAAYCQHFSVGSKCASFLILETERDYKRFDISDELAEIDMKDVAAFLDLQWKDAGKELTPKERFARFVEQIEKRTELISGKAGEFVKRLISALEKKDYELLETLVPGKVVRESAANDAYLTQRKLNRTGVGVYTAEAKSRSGEKDEAGALRALSSVVELYPGRCDALRLVGYRLLEMGAPGPAASLFWRVQESRPFEPQSYRDLARSYELAGKPGLAAVMYEILLAGDWHDRFGSVKKVVQEEYCLLMRAAVKSKAASQRVGDLLAARLAALGAAEEKADLRVTMSWNTDNTDIDLWVIEPSGEKCFYSHKTTKSGGVLLDDLTQGYGPERYHINKAQKGLYTIKVHYYATNPNLLGGETHVTITVTKFAGTDRQEVRRYNVTLSRHNQEEPVCRVEF